MNKKDTNKILNCNIPLFNDNCVASNGQQSNLLQYTNFNENQNFNNINSDENFISKDEQENNYLKSKINCNIINNFDCNSNNLTNVKIDNYNIIELLKNNPDIYSYIDIVDYLTYDDLLKMFSFILKNIMIFIPNSQSYLLINKVISLYNSSQTISNEIQMKISKII